MARFKFVVETSTDESEMSYDEIITSLFLTWVQKENLTLARVAEIAGIPIEEIEAFAAGEAPPPPEAFAPLLAYSHLTMSDIDESVIEFRRPTPPPPAKISSGYWHRVGKTWPDSLARFLDAAAPHLIANPSHGHALTESFKLLLRLSENKSDDIAELEAATDGVLKDFYQLERESRD